MRRVLADEPDEPGIALLPRAHLADGHVDRSRRQLNDDRREGVGVDRFARARLHLKPCDDGGGVVENRRPRDARRRLRGLPRCRCREREHTRRKNLRHGRDSISRSAIANRRNPTAPRQ